MRKYAIMLLPQLMLATTVSTDLKLEGLKPILEFNVSPKENLSFNSKLSYDMFEQNLEAKYKINENVEISGETFIGYENIKENYSKVEKEKFEEDKKNFEKLNTEIKNEDDLDKIIESVRNLKSENNIKEYIKGEVTRKDLYKKLKEKLETYGTRFGNAPKLLEKAIDAKTGNDEHTNVISAMISIGSDYNNKEMESNLKQGSLSLRNAFDNEKVNNQKVKESFESFYNFFSKSREFKDISEDFSKVAKLYEKAEEKKFTIKEEVSNKIRDLDSRLDMIKKGEGPNINLIRHHIYYGIGLGTKVNYLDFETILKARIGASTYLTKVDDEMKIENKIYGTLDGSLRYNLRVNKFNIIPSVGVKYIWAEYGQKGFIPYISIGANYKF